MKSVSFSAHYAHSLTKLSSMKSVIKKSKFRIALFFLLGLLALSAIDPSGINSLDGPVPGDEFINFESPHVYPLDLTPDGQKLLAVNTADNRLEVFELSSGRLSHLSSIPVGLDPVSVRARSNTEAWVVNHISDNISIVDLNIGVVVKSINTDNEPCDVVFAGTPGKAFVTCSEPNTLLIFDLNQLDKTPKRIKIPGEDPRMLAVSPDKSTVYGAFFESGNGSTIITGNHRIWSNDAITLPQSPYGSVQVPPNDGDQFTPPLNPDNPAPISVPIIVRKDESGRWMDDNNHDWSNLVSGEDAGLSRRVKGWDLPDRDIFVIDANSFQLDYHKRLMTMVMALDINPVSGEVSVVGTDAANEIRYEPNLNGVFSTVNLAKIQKDVTRKTLDLNPHLTYNQPRVSHSKRKRSIGDPRGIAWNAAGTRAFIIGMGSNNVVVVDQHGARVGNRPIAVGEGPTGIVLNEQSNQAFVLNKFEASVSVIDLNAGTEKTRIPFYDPTPQIIKDGRPLLYNTHLTSGTGHLSCATCHVDARTDQLAWDLGNPAGKMDGKFHPMKGPLRTQTLQDIIHYPSLHHRGDRADLFAFAPTYVSLQGMEQPPSNGEMTQFEAFLSTIHYPPNPYRNLDHSISDEVAVPGPNGEIRVVNAGVALDKLTRDCNKCHEGNHSRSTNTLNESHQVACNLRGIYDRMGMYYESKDGSTQGFGLRPEGSASSSLNLHHSAEMLGVLLQFDGSLDVLDDGSPLPLSVHTAVGEQVTINGALPKKDIKTLNTLLTLAEQKKIGLIVKGRYADEMRGFYYTGKKQFQSDRSAQTVAFADLVNAGLNTQPVTFTAVPFPARIRMGVDRDADGVFDMDEKELGVWATPSSSLVIAASQEFEVYLNGELVGQGNDWRTAQAIQNIQWKEGKNVIAIKVTAYRDGGCIAELRQGSKRLGTNKDWKVATWYQNGWNSPQFDDTNWEQATEKAAFGEEPWKHNVIGLAYDTPAKWIWSNNQTASVYLRYAFEQEGSIDGVPYQEVTTKNEPPSAQFEYIYDEKIVRFDAANAFDPDGEIVSYTWDFGDGTEATGKYPFHQYATSGTYEVTLLVEDNTGAIGMHAQTVDVTCVGYVRTFTPNADASVRIDAPNRNFGKGDLWTHMLRNDIHTEAIPSAVSYLRFDVGSVDLTRLRSASLLVRKSPDGISKGLFEVFKTTSYWKEYTVDWNDRPNLSEKPYGTWMGAFRRSREIHKVELDPEILNNIDGTLNLALYPYARTADPPLTFLSRESPHPPTLVLEFEDCNELQQSCSELFDNLYPHNYAVGSINKSGKVYSDRIYEVLSMPQFLTNRPLILTKNDDKKNNGYAMVRFELLQDATLYVAFDTRAGSLPHWLRDWTNTGMTIITTDNSYLLYSKPFKAGYHSLHGNAASGAANVQNNYFVIGDCNIIPVNPSGIDPFKMKSEKNALSTRRISLERPVGINEDHKTRNILDPENNILKIEAFPNPFNESLNLKMSSMEKYWQTIVIHNAAGQVVFETKITPGDQHQIHTAQWEAGLYLISIKNDGMANAIKVLKR